MHLPSLRPIGFIHTPFDQQVGTPIQPSRAKGAEGLVDILPEFADGLRDLEGFSHAHLLFVFHKSEGFSLSVTPYLDDTPRGLFATRAPRRPNPIGLSIVRILSIEGTRIRVGDVDMLDGTPLLDIKPFLPDFDHRPEARTGWYERQARPENDRADDRFENDR
jgi:tRNA (adenine37-N6)-methyltransferase